ncbi:MAG: hypothetical protein HFE76_08975 [Firmicutes bacterium]|nr:hypothetical protein [Bacillota bacterium]
MSDYKELIESAESFYIDAVEEFKEAEQKIINDSRFRSIFQKKDYDGNIAHLKACRKEALEINLEDIQIDAEDKESRQMLQLLGSACSAFAALCDAYVQLQVFLKKKSMKEETSFSAYKEIFDKVKQCRDEASKALHNLDMIYTDYMESHGE